MIIGSISASLIISRLMRISSIMVLRFPRVSIIGARPVARLILLVLSLIFLMLSTSLVILLRLRYQWCLVNKSLMAGPSVQASYLIGSRGGASWHASEHLPIIARFPHAIRLGGFIARSLIVFHTSIISVVSLSIIVLVTWSFSIINVPL